MDGGSRGIRTLAIRTESSVRLHGYPVLPAQARSRPRARLDRSLFPVSILLVARPAGRNDRKGVAHTQPIATLPHGVRHGFFVWTAGLAADAHGPPRRAWEPGGTEFPGY